MMYAYILHPMGSMVCRNPRTLSSALPALETLQPIILRFLNTIDPLDAVSNCYPYNIKFGWKASIKQQLQNFKKILRELLNLVFCKPEAKFSGKYNGALSYMTHLSAKIENTTIIKCKSL